MDETSTNLNLPYLQAAQAQKHLTHNAALEQLDLIVQLVVQSFGQTIPPLAPDEGQVWAIGTGAVDDWVGHDNELAAWSNDGWLFIVPRPGWRAAMGGEIRLFDGAAWVAPDLPVLQNLPGVGINTSHDATNKLAVAADATLLDNIGAGHQLKVNKALPGDTASLLFQTGYSGRAEMGTAGTDDFSIKVSADGAAWQTALSVAASNGLVTGMAVTQSPTDTTTGRLLKLGDTRLSPGDAAIEASDLDAIAGLGFWAIGTGAANKPDGLGGTGSLLAFQRAAARRAQLAANGGTGNRWAVRTQDDSGVWHPWAALVHSRNLLGAVSQSAGLPTGAVIERGSNSNGSYVRFADGTQICWIIFDDTAAAWTTAAGSFFRRDPNWAWSYAAAFSTAPTVLPTAQFGDERLLGARPRGAPGAVSALIQVWASAAAAAGAAKTIAAVAFGRWF